MKIGDQIPELHHAGTWVNATRKTDRDLTGKGATMIYFWSTDCDSCRGAVRRMKQVCNGLLEDMNLISVHTPLKGKGHELEMIRKAAEEYGMTEPLLIETDEAVSQMFRVRSVPAFYLFDRSGRLRHAQSGNKGMTMLRSRIARILEKE